MFAIRMQSSKKHLIAPECGTTFAYRQNLLKHLRNIHNKTVATRKQRINLKPGQKRLAIKRNADGDAVSARDSASSSSVVNNQPDNNTTPQQPAPDQQQQQQQQQQSADTEASSDTPPEPVVGKCADLLNVLFIQFFAYNCKLFYTFNGFFIYIFIFLHFFNAILPNTSTLSLLSL